MKAVKFLATIGEDQVIRPPAGISIPGGEVEVTVRVKSAEPQREDDDLAETREWLLGLAREAEAIEGTLPSDMAENHDHYAHGKPLP